MFRIALCLLLTAGCHKAGSNESTSSGGGAGGEVEIKMTAASGQVRMLEGKGGNIGVFAGPDGVVLIDAQFAELVPKITKAVESLGHGAPKYLINTHWHGDHTGGNPLFGKSAVIVAHDNTRRRLTTGWKRGDEQVEPIEKSGWPVITFADSVRLHLNGEYLDVVYFGRGHTDGDSVIFFTGSNAVHMGDLYFNGRFPFVDLSSGGSVGELMKAIDAVLPRIEDDTSIIPGHGKLSNKTELLAYREMLIETTSVVRNAMDAGKSLDEIKKAGLPAKYDSWATDFVTADKWIETIHHSFGQGS